MRGSKKNKSFSPIRLYFKALFLSTLIFFVLSTGIVYGFMHFYNKPNTDFDDLHELQDGQPSEDEGAKGGIFDMFLPPAKTNFLVFGVDNGSMLTDVILLGCFDRETKEIDLISIPRDTYIVMSKSLLDSLKSEGRYAPMNGVMKINAVHSYAGEELGPEYLRKQIENLMGIKITYDFRINLEAFREIVDLLGGVDIEVPEGGLYYKDPYQNLTISIPEGVQHLDGKMAEGFVRYRDTYARGDLQRIDMQHMFMKELFEQVLNDKNIVRNAYNLIRIMLEHVDTNFGIDDLPLYASYINSLHMSSINTTTLPGAPQTINGASYYMPNREEMYVLVDEIFY